MRAFAVIAAISLIVSAIAADAPGWSQLPPIPDAEGFAAAFAGVSGGALIVAGGANITGDRWADPLNKRWYDTAFVLEQPDGAWRTGFRLPRALAYGVSITADDSVICIGGSDATSHHAEVFRLSWRAGELRTEPLPSLPRPCANACGALGRADDLRRGWNRDADGDDGAADFLGARSGSRHGRLA